LKRKRQAACKLVDSDKQTNANGIDKALESGYFQTVACGPSACANWNETRASGCLQTHRFRPAPTVLTQCPASASFVVTKEIAKIF
jgi:hypothetical protein